MKFAGHTFSPNREYVVIPRPDGDIAFTLQPCDFKEFTKLCPEPKPPTGLAPGGVKVTNPSDPNYVLAMEQYSEKRVAFMVIQALQATDGFEWDTVKVALSDTWLSWKQEFYDAHFTEGELVSIIRGALSVNALDGEKIEAARANFLRIQAEAAKGPAK